jgi:hypothetical protein
MTTPKHKVPKLKIQNPLYPFIDQLNFNDYYTPIITYNFNVHDCKQEKIYIGKGKNRKCCVCMRKEPEATFSQETHAIPVAFGNRWLFSLEECDACNAKLGKKYENDLAKMFSAQRIFGRVQKRKGYPKLRIPDKKSKMEILENKIAISIENKEHDFNFKELGDNTISLSVPVPPYYPAHAIKSLAHTLWLVLDEKRRIKYSDILRWITNEIQFSSYNYYEGLVPGPGSGLLSFLVWEKIKEHENLTDLIIKFHFSNTFIFWELPDFKSNKYLPGILPDVDISTFYPYEPKISFESIGHDKQNRPKRAHFTLMYEKKEEFTGDNSPKSYFDLAELNKKKTRNKYYTHTGKPFPVRLSAIKDNEKIVIDHSYLVPKDISKEHLQFLISGGHLAGSIELISFRNKSANLTMKLNFEALPPTLAKNSFLFFKTISAGCDLEIKDLATGISDTLKTPFCGTILDDDIFIILEFLELINNEFKTLIRYSNDFTKKELQDICYLANGIKYRKFESETKRFQIRIKITDLHNVTKIFKRKPNSIYIRQKGTFVIRNVAVEAGDFKIVAVNPKLTATTYINKEFVEIDITADSIIFDFEKYHDKINKKI